MADRWTSQGWVFPDLTGLGAFTGINSLDCSDNLIYLDVSAIPVLQYLELFPKLTGQPGCQ